MTQDRDARRRRLAAIVFTDIVGYSALVNRDELAGARALDLQRRVVRRHVARYGGREIETAGDSFLLEFASPFAALRCVAAIQRALADPAPATGEEPVQLRASLHVGEVAHRGREVFGDTVNIAARLLPLASPGGLALSDQAWLLLRARLELSPLACGLQQLKNIRQPVGLYRLEAEELARVPLESGDVCATLRGWARGHRAGWGAALAASVLLGAAANLLAGRLPATAPEPASIPLAPTEAGDHRHIAVLPFATFSSGSDDPLLAGGLQDGILTSLANLPELSVISRTSVAGYQATGARSIPEIARQLGVDTVIEGSLQRAGNRLLVQVQLIDAKTDRHLWAKSYERPLTDLFEVQAAIARDIAGTIRIRLREPDRRRLEAKPTTSLAAFTEFRRAAEALERGADGLPVARAAAARALALDPDFALGHVLQAHLDLHSYFAADDHSERQLRRVKESLIRASELAPDLAEAHRGWGSYYLYGRDDADSALAEFEAARAVRPGDADTLRAIGGLHLRVGRMADAMRHLQRASELDPRSTEKLTTLALGQMLMRDYAGSARTVASIEALSPGLEGSLALRAQLSFLERGNSEELRQLVARLEGADERAEFDYYRGDIDGALAQLGEARDWIDDGFGGAPLPRVWYRARYLLGAGRPAEAKRAFAEAEPLLAEALAVPAPYQSTQRAARAVALAALGRHDEASTLAAALRRDPDLAKPLFATLLRTSLAMVALQAGNKPAAIAELRAALATPTLLSAASLRSDPLWKPLQAQPEFIAVLRTAGEASSALLAQAPR